MIFDLIIDWIWVVLMIITWILFIKMKKLKKDIDKSLGELAIKSAVLSMRKEKNERVS